MPSQDSPQKHTEAFFIREGSGVTPGVYTTEELKKLPKKTLKYSQTAGSALRDGLIDADHSSSEYLHSLNFYSPPSKKTGKPKEMHGVQEGVWDTNEGRSKKFIKPSTKKIGNKLRSKLKSLKDGASESSIKAQIAARRAGNGAQSHPSDAGH